MAQAGKIVSEKDALKWAGEFKDFLTDLECGRFFSKDIIHKLLYDYGDEVKGFWIRYGIKKGKPEVIIHSVNADSNITDNHILGSGEEGKPPGD